MSRIIVKGLPDKITEEQLKKKFCEKGSITECSLKFTKEGVFRKFAFIGFKEVSMATDAVTYFNQSFINTSRITVSIASDMSEKRKQERKVEPWSKVNQKVKENNKDNNKDNIKNNNKDNNTNINKDNIKAGVNNKKNKKVSTRTEWAIKVTGLAAGVKKDEIEKFFKPLKCHIQNGGHIKGKVVVCLESEEDKEEAMRRNKHYIGTKKIFLHKCNAPSIDDNNNNNKNNSNNNNDDDDDDDDDEEFGNDKRNEPTHKIEDKSKERGLIAETGRLFVLNLPYCTTHEELEGHFSSYGELEVQLQIDKHNDNRSKGFCLLSYVLPENALKAYDELDGSVFQGRMLHIVGGKAKREDNNEDIESLPFDKKKQVLKKLSASNVKSWNSLFVGGDAVADVVAMDNQVSKHDLLMHDSDVSVAAHLALEQTRIVNETRTFLLEQGVSLDSFSQASADRSKTVLLVKHLPAHTSVDELETVFQKFSQSVKRILLPPSGLTAIVEFSNPIDASNAFKSLAYTRFKHLPLFLEKAPMDVFKTTHKKKKTNEKESLEFTSEDAKVGHKDGNEEKEEDKEEEEEEDDEDEEDEGEVDLSEPRRSVYVRNLPGDVKEEDIREEFKQYGSIVSISLIAGKGVAEGGNDGSSGFIEWGTRDQAEAFVRDKQNSSLQGRSLQLKISDRLVKDADLMAKKLENKLKKDRKKKTDKNVTPKIIMRNVPFEASEEDLKQLLSVFTGVKAIRLPKKGNTASGTMGHRGFAFVEFVNKTCSKRAFKQLCHNTALYGRRLSLEYCKGSGVNDVGNGDVQEIRKRTAEKYNPDKPKKSKKSDLLDDMNKYKN